MFVTGKSKRVLVLSDLHCGHRNGIYVDCGEHWKFFKEVVDSLRPVDICIGNGDLIEGRGEKSGSTELITADRQKQVEMAVEVLEFIGARKYIFTYGTQYHVSSSGEDWEELIAKHFKADIRGQQFLDVNGLHFHVKHKINKSTVPHGRFTPLARQKVWNLFWAETKQVPRCHIFLRSHVHYFDYCGGKNWFAAITPALQGWGSRHGERECEGTIEFGVIHFDIYNENKWEWKAHIAAVESAHVHHL